VSRKETVLVIDDSMLIHNLLDVWLRPENLTVLHALDGVTGMAIAIEQQPSLILLDLVLEHESGYDVVRTLMECVQTRDIPVMILTGAADTENKVRCLDAGAVDYITKPFDPAELRARARVGLRLRRYQELLAHQARIDALTACWNRGYLDERLSSEVTTSWRHGRPVAFVLVDLDHFKAINDSRGHAAGDRALQAVADQLRNSLRAGDTLGRLGGDEFAIVARETPLEGLHAFVHRLVELVRSVPDPIGSGYTVSVGGALLSQVCASSPQEAVQALYLAADTALYDAKRRGRNQGVVYSDALDPAAALMVSPLPAVRSAS
jgi:two-component system cell cycle response regulator